MTRSVSTPDFFRNWLLPAVTRGFGGLWVGILLFGCEAAEDRPQAELPAQDSLSTTERRVEAFVYSLPPPDQIIRLLKQAGARYERNLLNPDSKASGYTTSRSQALNLGVYSADLAFASGFDQSQDALRYYLAVQKLAQPLGLSGIFSQELARRMEQQKGNADSVTALAAEAFRQTNARLKANGQPDAAALILVGGWIEGLYLATGLYDVKPSEGLAQQIALQKHALPSVLALYRESGAASAQELQLLTKGLADLEQAFDPITFAYAYGGVVTDSTRRVTRVDNTSTPSFTANDIAALVGATRAVRTLLVR